jgi:hypothetical protein
MQWFLFVSVPLSIAVVAVSSASPSTRAILVVRH